MLYALGFIVVFVIGGLTGVMFAAVAFDQQVTDSYFVVAHFHYVLFGGAVFPILGALHYWLPKMSGRMYSEALGRLNFALVFVGFNLTFFPMHIAGLLGMPRRVYTWPGGLGWDVYNLLSSIGAAILALGLAVLVVTLLGALRWGAPAPADPWGGNTLEWSVSSPPPPYNFETLPLVRSADPMWDPEPPDPELVLDDGHQTLGTTVLEGEPDDILDMPTESMVPIALAAAIALIFFGLLGELWLLAGAGAALSLCALAWWHKPERRLQEQ
jgi:heme/copper-type cytochrome/quinol oxidase subunit 1